MCLRLGKVIAGRIRFTWNVWRWHGWSAVVQNWWHWEVSGVDMERRLGRPSGYGRRWLMLGWLVMLLGSIMMGWSLLWRAIVIRQLLHRLMLRRGHGMVLVIRWHSRKCSCLPMRRPLTWPWRRMLERHIRRVSRIIPSRRRSFRVMLIEGRRRRATSPPSFGAWAAAPVDVSSPSGLQIAW